MSDLKNAAEIYDYNHKFKDFIEVALLLESGKIRLYRDSSGQFFLLFLCEKLIEGYNRWLVVPVSFKTLSNIYSKEINFLEAIQSNENLTVDIIDSKPPKNIKKAFVISPRNIPQNYISSFDFEYEESPKYSKSSIFHIPIDGHWTFRDIHYLPKKFMGIYILQKRIS